MSDGADDSLDLLVRIKSDTSGATVAAQSLKDVKAELKDSLDPALAHFGKTEDGVAKSGERMHISHRELHRLLGLLGPQFAEAGHLAMFSFAGPAVAGLAAVALAAGKVLGDWKKAQEAIATAPDLSGIDRTNRALGSEGMLKALIEGGVAADEFWEKVNRLANAQESLKNKTDDATEALHKQHEADTKAASERERAELAELRVMEEMGKISKDEAARRKTDIENRYAGQELNRKAIEQDDVIDRRKHEREVAQRVVNEAGDVAGPKQIAAAEAAGDLAAQKAALDSWKQKLADAEKWLLEQGPTALGAGREGRETWDKVAKLKSLAGVEVANRENDTVPEAEKRANRTKEAADEAQKKVEEAAARKRELDREIAKLEADKTRDRETATAEASARSFAQNADSPIGRAAAGDVAAAAATAHTEAASRKTGVHAPQEAERQLIDVATRISGHQQTLQSAVAMMKGVEVVSAEFTQDAQKLVTVMTNIAASFKKFHGLFGHLDTIDQQVKDLQGQMASRGLNAGG
jgi:membrane protein involved in colicin uptake